jgi:DNA-directed RNA polymerase specialized sigma24 family protein
MTFVLSFLASVRCFPVQKNVIFDLCILTPASQHNHLHQGSHASLSVRELYDRYASYVLGFLLRSTENAADAEELSVQVWLEVVRRKPGNTMPLQELLQVARQVIAAGASDHARKKELDLLAGILKNEGDPDSNAVCAKMLELMYYKGYTATQIAEALGVNKEIVQQRIRKELKKREQ